VISAGFGLQDLIARYGIERRVYTAGKSKSMLDPFREENQEDVERLRSILGDVHDVFIQHVKTSRGAKITQDIDVFTGEVWLAERAKELGLIDEVGHLVPTLKDRFGDKVKLRVIEQKRSFSQRFGLSISDRIRADKMVWIMSLVGLVILLLSGDLLVRGAVNLSLRLGVPALIVSLTIV